MIEIDEEVTDGQAWCALILFFLTLIGFIVFDYFLFKNDLWMLKEFPGSFVMLGFLEILASIQMGLAPLTKRNKNKELKG